jgi:hypothetical protein
MTVPERNVCSLEFGNGLDSVERARKSRRLAVAREAEEKWFVLVDILEQDMDVRTGLIDKGGLPEFRNPIWWSRKQSDG